MTTADGSVGGVTKIVDHGPNTSRWNLVIVGDGYRAGELAQYHTDAQAFVDAIRVTPPYPELWCGINVHRVDVTSTDSGADDPTTCAGGTGATPRTYFDSTFCSSWGGGNLDRLLTANATVAQSVATTAVPDVDQVLVIVNSSKYGGSGGGIAVCSTNAQASQIAIHEIGHSAFGLADEYEGAGSALGMTEPGEPNVTLDANRATNKWRALIQATTPMPSACNGTCTTCSPPATAPAAGAVGAYEGAQYKTCDMYRPLPSCYMRDYSPFCPVCAGVIRQVLQPFAPPESITLTTPSTSFVDVPEGIGGTGVTTHRAIVFEVATCRRLTFRIIAGPTGGFTTPLGIEGTAGSAAYTPFDYARVWIGYTSTTAPATASGSVTVRCIETGQTWVINISANTVERPKSAVVLVLDRSGSMSEDAGDGTTKVTKLREAAGIFLEAMLPGDGIGVVRFDDTVQRLMDVTDVGPLSGGAGRTAAIGHINGSELDPAGATSIGGGVVEGKATLDAAQAVAVPPYDVRAMVVLTDGVENTAPMLSTVGASISANTFAIGLGLPYNISTAALDTLTQGTGGYLLVTGALTPDQRTRLSKYFLQVLAGITNANVVEDPHGELAVGTEHRIPFAISEADYGFDAFVLTDYPQLLDFQLEAPDGSRIDPSTFGALGTTELVVRAGVAFYRVALPAIPQGPAGSHRGTWYIVLGIGKRSPWGRLNYAAASHPQVAAASAARGVLPYDAIVHCYSNLTFSAHVSQRSYEVGAEVRMVGDLREYDVPVIDRASVWAEITGPGGTGSVVALAPDGFGLHIGQFTTGMPGVYRVRIRARGETLDGTPFTREQTRTAVAVPGGDRPPEVTTPGVIDLLCCLLSDREGAERFAGRLEGLGIDPHELRRCLGDLCQPSAADIERGHKPG
jgi:IgA Peptidase M64/von Willebrand factor type A domain